MRPFQQLDYIRLDDQFSEDERMVRDTVRSWVTERYLPLAMEHFEAGTFPMQLVPELAELGVFGPTIPAEYGCAGLNNVAAGLIYQELERGDSGLRSFVSVQGGLVMYPIYAFGSEAQKQHWLPQLASGKAIGCFGLTEPDFGSNPGGMLTTAKQGRQGLGAQRPQDVDHQRHRLRRGRRLGARRRHDPRLPGRRRARPASARPSRSTSSACAPRSRASSCCRTSSCPRTRSLPEFGRARSRRWPA